MTAEPLSDAEIAAALDALEGWTRAGDSITRAYQAFDFPGAIHVVNIVASLAEEAQHHPDIDIRWRNVTFTLSTHDAGGKVTRADTDMAAQINAAIALEQSAR